MSYKKQQKRGLQTTQSGQRKGQLGSSLVLKPSSHEISLQGKTISPFDVGTEPELQDIDSIKQINFTYMKFFQRLIETTNFQPSQELSQNRESKYQQQSYSLVQQNEELIRKIEVQKGLEQDWKELTNYLNEKNQHIEPEQLVQSYKEMDAQLQYLQKQTNNLSRKQISVLDSMQDDGKLTDLQKQFKQTKKILKGEIGKKEYYFEQCQKYQTLLDQLQKKRQKYNSLHQDLKMKIVSACDNKERKRKKQTRKFHSNQKSFQKIK